jgi:hypothetical protein
VHLPRLAALLVAVVAITSCHRHVPAAENIDRSRPDAKTCDAFIKIHGGHFHASGAINIPTSVTNGPSASAYMDWALRTTRSFNGGADCTVFMRGSDLKAAKGCRDGMGEFLVAADAQRYVQWPCFYG